jgi:Ca2+-binding EF-hand superfamily protein
MSHVGERLMEKFGSIASIFRYFDLRMNSGVTLTDFCFGLDQLGFGMDQDEVLKIFTYLDSNKDNLIKFQDFCILVNQSNNQ